MIPAASNRALSERGAGGNRGFAVRQDPQQWLHPRPHHDNRMERILKILSRIEQLVRREQTNHRADRAHRLIGYSKAALWPWKLPKRS
jgi:hypothetical protein